MVDLRDDYTVDNGVSPAVDQTAQRLMSVIPAMFRQMKNDSRDDLPPAFCDMGEGQVRILHILSHQDFTMGELAERMHVTAPTVSRTVDNLVARGLVDRHPDANDRRRIWLRLTSEGYSLAGQLELRFRLAMERFLQPLTSDQLALVLAACDTLEGLLAADRITDSKPIVSSTLVRGEESSTNGNRY